jgi:hypothetical protein
MSERAMGDVTIRVARELKPLDHVARALRFQKSLLKLALQTKRYNVSARLLTQNEGRKATGGNKETKGTRCKGTMEHGLTCNLHVCRLS